MVGLFDLTKTMQYKKLSYLPGLNYLVYTHTHTHTHTPLLGARSKGDTVL